VAVTPAPRPWMQVPPLGQSPSAVHVTAVSLVQTLSGIVWCVHRMAPVSRSSAVRRPFVHGLSECYATPMKTRLPATVGEAQT